MENFTLSQSGQMLSMTLYVGLSLFVGYMATMAGMYLVKFI
jgi:fluoride ion exporter CrcB/FEX